jgi:hypothetical protein
MKKAILLMILALIPALVLAQDYSNLQQPYLKKNSTSLFDPSRLTMHQSVSFGYYSGGAGSGSMGYYLNSLEYSISNPLKIRVDLGYMANTSALFSRNSSSTKTGTFVPGVSLDWRPSSAFHFSLDFRQVPVYNYGNYNNYYNPALWEDNH